MTDLHETLQKTPPFSSFDQQGLSKVEVMALRRHYRDGEFAACYGEAFPYIFLVAGGAFRALKESVEGRSLILLTLEVGEVFWGLTFFDKTAILPVSLQSAGESSLVMWSHADLYPLLLDYSQVLWELCALFAQRVQRASDIVEDLAFHPVAGRLAGLLLDQYGGKGAEPVARSMTLDEMAARVSTTREMVCRVLYRFSDQEIIHITRTEFALVDEDRLALLSGRANRQRMVGQEPRAGR